MGSSYRGRTDQIRMDVVVSAYPSLASYPLGRWSSYKYVNVSSRRIWGIESVSCTFWGYPQVCKQSNWNQWKALLCRVLNCCNQHSSCRSLSFSRHCLKGELQNIIPQYNTPPKQSGEEKRTFHTFYQPIAEIPLLKGYIFILELDIHKL